MTMAQKVVHLRWCWLRDRVEAYQFVDILNSDFVWEYIEKFGFASHACTIGAPVCKQLNRDLAKMAKLGYLKRTPTGISDGNWQPGFPKWVYSYQLGHYSKYLNPPRQAPIEEDRTSPGIESKPPEP
jgi:hypothetical protein